MSLDPIYPPIQLKDNEDVVKNPDSSRFGEKRSSSLLVDYLNKRSKSVIKQNKIEQLYIKKEQIDRLNEKKHIYQSIYNDRKPSFKPPGQNSDIQHLALTEFQKNGLKNNMLSNQRQKNNNSQVNLNIRKNNSIIFDTVNRKSEWYCTCSDESKGTAD